MASVVGAESDAAGGGEVDGVSLGCPRIKPEHAPYLPAAGRVRIDGEIPGIASNLEDPSGAISALLESMDGPRAVEEIADCVAARCPEQARAAVTVCVQRLIDGGSVEDAPAPGLSAREQDRHERSRRYFRWLALAPRASSSEPQLRSRDARETVFGVGASGGSAAPALPRSRRIVGRAAARPARDDQRRVGDHYHAARRDALVDAPVRPRPVSEPARAGGRFVRGRKSQIQALGRTAPTLR